MSIVARITSAWRNLLHRDRVDRELDDELRAYVDLDTERRMHAGMSASAARRAALVDAGGLEHLKDEVRQVRAGQSLHTILQDARYAVRTLGRTTGFTLAAVAALSLGVGATTAIFSVVDAVLLRPLPYRDADRLAVILHHGTDPVSVANFIDWRAQSRSFERMGAADYWTPNITGGDRPEKIWALHLTGDVFPLLGVRPMLGRVPGPEDDVDGRDRVVVLSQRLWERRFASDSGVLGRTITLDGNVYTIIGVMPRDFRFAPFWATKAELWAPLAFGARVTNRGGNSLRVFARLRPGVTLDAARADMAAITARLDQQYPGTNRDVVVAALKDRVVGNVRVALFVLLGAVGFVLLIACANVAHMLLARAASRRREIALRTALGASRARIVRQLLTESLLLALAGGAGGVVLAASGIRALVALSPSDIPRIEAVRLNLVVLAVTLGLTIATGLLFGLVPALHAARADLSDVLRQGERGSSEGGHRHRARSLLVASEFALALVLLAGAGLMIRTFVALQGVDPGFDPRNLLTAVVSVTGTNVVGVERRSAFFQDLLRQVRALPGVTSASAINHLPLAGDIWGWPFWIEGRPIPRPGEGHGAAYRVVMPGYFAAMRIPLLRGRDVTDRDDLHAAGVVVVNERLASTFWPGESAIGKRMTLADPTSADGWVTVVGVAKDAKQDDWTTTPDFEVYLPYLQNRNYLESPRSHVSYLTLVVRTTGDAAALTAAVRHVVQAIEPQAPLSEIQTMAQVIADSTARPRFYLMLFGAFAVVAVALAAVGIYGVMSYAVARRTNEIGIRMALGASRRDVLGHVVGEGMRIAIAGAAAGVLGALALTRVMTKLLYGVQPGDPVTFVVVSLVLAVVALAASWIPARRATRIDPLVALRGD